MENYNLIIPVQVRYGDLDPQWHVNNARFLTFIEQARFTYLRRLDLWDGVDFFKIGLIVADIHMSYLAPIKLGQNIQVGIRTSKIGNKSLIFEYQIEDADTGAVLGKAETVMVSYDYNADASMRIPDDWRRKIAAFEHIPSGID